MVSRFVCFGDTRGIAVPVPWWFCRYGVLSKLRKFEIFASVRGKKESELVTAAGHTEHFIQRSDAGFGFGEACASQRLHTFADG